MSFFIYVFLLVTKRTARTEDSQKEEVHIIIQGRFREFAKLKSAIDIDFSKKGCSGNFFKQKKNRTGELPKSGKFWKQADIGNL